MQESDSCPSSSALEKLNSVTGSCEDTMTNKNLTSMERLKVFTPAVKQFFDQEAQQIIGHDLKVVNHSALGHLQGAILAHCTCAAASAAPTKPSKSSKDKSKDAAVWNGGCSFHNSDPDLNELMFAITNSVFRVFGDNWACFAAVFAHEATKGSFGEGHVSHHFMFNVTFNALLQ